MFTKTDANMKIKLKYNQLISIIAAVIIILNSGYYLTTITDSYIPLLILIGFSVILLLNRAKVNTIRITSSNIILILLMIGILMSSIVNFSYDNLLSGGRVAMTMLCSYIIVTKVDFHYLVKSYTKIIRIVIIASFLLFLLTRLGTLTFLPRISTANGEYYNLLFVIQNITSSRASGVFWEPGVFASHIIFAALLDIYLSERQVKLTNIIIYLVGIYLAASTAGILIAMIVFIGYVIQRAGWSKSIVVDVIFFALVIVAIFTYEIFFEWLANLNPMLFSKLTDTTLGTTFTRLNAPLVNMEIFLEKPLFGWGFTDAATQFSRNMNYALVAQTSTSTQIMAAIGILGILYTLMCIFPIFNKKKLPQLKLIDKFILAGALLLIINKEPHIFFSITWVILFYVNRTNSIKIEE